MNKVIFCDIDGTILDGSRGMMEVSDKTRYAMKQLKDNGDHVVIASGRCKGLLDPKILSLDPSGYILCNGAYAEFMGKEIYSLYFTRRQLSAIKRIVSKYNGFVIFEALDEMYVDSLQSESFKAFMKGWGSSLDGFKEGGEGRSDFLIGMIGFLDRSVMKDVEEELSEYVDLAAHKQFNSYDVNIKGVNKAIGTKRIIKYLDIPLEDTYCFGDAINDLEMLQSVGHPVIVANCADELRGYGFEETDDVLDDGFYNYLVSHKLIKAL